MKALIIAAGEGSRLRNDEGIPKPLTKIDDLSLIERIILNVKGAGIEEFVIVIGYQGEKIKERLEDGTRLGVKITYVVNDEWKKSNGISVLKAKDYLKENFFLLMSDHLFEQDIVRNLKEQMVEAGEIMLAVDYNLSSELIDVDDVTKVAIKNNLIKNIGKEIDSYHAHDTGIFLCSPGLFQALENCMQNGDCSLSEGIKFLAQENKARTFNIGNRSWVDVDTKYFLQKAEELVRKNIF